MSTKSAILADSLTRESTTTRREMALLREATSLPVLDVLKAWLGNPKEDWDLPMALLMHVKNII